MAKYRNTGGPHRRKDGTFIEKGDVFEPTDRELRTLADKLEPVGATLPAPAPAAGDAPPQPTEPKILVRRRKGGWNEVFVDGEQVNSASIRTGDLPAALEELGLDIERAEIVEES